MRLRLAAALAAAFSCALAGLATAQARDPGHGRDAAGRVRGFEVLAHANPSDAYSGDVVGHAGHAYLSSHRGRDSCPAAGVRVLDVRDRRRPRHVATFARIAGTWTEKTIVRRVRTARFAGDLAVTSVQACRPGAFEGFAVFDVTRPARPRRLALVRTTPRGSHELWLAAARGKAWVYTAILASELRSSPDGRTPGQPDFRIFDVSDPRRPRQVGGWGAWRALGIHPARRAGVPTDTRLVHSVVTNRAATRAFLSYWDLGTVVLNIADPARPRYLGRTAATENAHSAWLGRNETLLVETHETDGGTPTLWDVSRPRAPRLLGELRLSERLLAEGRRERLAVVAGLELGDSVHDAKVAGTTGYFSWYRQGVVAADLRDPRRPAVLARFLPPESPDPERLLCPDARCTAFLGVDVLPDGTVLASDMLSGLWILRLR